VPTVVPVVVSATVVVPVAVPVSTAAASLSALALSLRANLFLGFMIYPRYKTCKVNSVKLTKKKNPQPEREGGKV
jgi:hypothetical protein